MNYLVFLDAQAGELEKILSGLKTMLIKEFDPTQIIAYPLSPGDSLYFLRDNGECELLVKATIVRVLSYENSLDEELPHILKEMQPRLQLTDGQYNYWCTQNQAWLVEFESAHKIGVIQVALDKILDRTGWIANSRKALADVASAKSMESEVTGYRKRVVPECMVHSQARGHPGTIKKVEDESTIIIGFFKLTSQQVKPYFTF